jgi:hypothetical protein
LFAIPVKREMCSFVRDADFDLVLCHIARIFFKQFGGKLNSDLQPNIKIVRELLFRIPWG